MPRLSIVTVCWNDRAGLARTLDSVAEQCFRDFEVVVVDGGSTDGSVGEARRRGELVTRLVSEKDGGVYDAQNKGAALASGDYLLFLNSGDHLASPDALARFFASDFDEDLVYGDVLYAKARRRRLSRAPDRLDADYLMRSNPCTQSILWRRQTFDRVGRHDLSYRLVADYDLLLRIVLGGGASQRHVPVTLAIHHRDGISARRENEERIAAERGRSQERWMPPEVRFRHAEQRAWRQGSMSGRIRAAFRPLARRLRGLSRRLRGVPD